jgi:hypothetical protein
MNALNSINLDGVIFYKGFPLLLIYPLEMLTNGLVTASGN